jgi:hypothetical protein
MRRFIAWFVATSLSLGSIGVHADNGDRPPGGSPGNQPQPAPTPTYVPAPAPTTVAPPPIYTPPPGPTISGQGTITVNPPPTTTPPPPVYVPPPGGDVAMGGLYDVYVRDDVPNMTHRLSFTDGRPIAACTGNCTFRVPPGQYLLEVDATSDLRAGKKIINVGGPTIVDVSPGSKGTHTTGLVLGIIGPVAIFAGLIGAVVVAAENSTTDFECSSSSSYSSSCNKEKSSATPWLLLLAGGIGATTAGWIMFGTSNTKIKPGPGVAPTPAVAWGVAPTNGGASLGLRVSF